MNTIYSGCGAGGTIALNGTASVSGNAAQEGSGGGIYNQFNLTLKSSSSVSGNTAFVDGGGILNEGGTLDACDSSGVDEWTGAISPNDPDDPPTVTLITCT